MMTSAICVIRGCLSLRTELRPRYSREYLSGRMQMTNETFGQIGILCQVSRTDQEGGDLVWTWRREPWHCNHLVRSL
jgi:hypothetical protein